MMALLAYNCCWEDFPHLHKELCHHLEEVYQAYGSLVLNPIIFLGISFFEL